MNLAGALKSGLLFFVNLMRLWETHWLVMQIDSSLHHRRRARYYSEAALGRRGPSSPPDRTDRQAPAVPLGNIVDRFFNTPGVAPERAMLGEHLHDVGITLPLVTWGKEGHLIRLDTLRDVSDRFYGGFAFPRFRGGASR
jgi:hypothetical protein